MKKTATRIAQAYYEHVTQISEQIPSKKRRDAILQSATYKAGAVCDLLGSWEKDMMDRAQLYFLAMAALRPRVTGLTAEITEQYELEAVRATIAEFRELGIELTALNVVAAVKRDERKLAAFE